MKKVLIFLILFFLHGHLYSQLYIPMPADSGAVWRYRINDIDFITQITDNILFLDGHDTLANGHTYHRIISRVSRQTGPVGFDPPIVPVEATAPDTYYGAFRESAKQVYLLTATGEKLMFNFNAGVGDTVPAYQSFKMVTAIDSVSLDGIFHKRYLTADTAYYIIEGVGSSHGLIPDLVDGTLATEFLCFTNGLVTFSPDTSLPCTYIYPIGYHDAVTEIKNQNSDVSVFPVPAGDVVHIKVDNGSAAVVDIYNDIGRAIWCGTVAGRADIPVSSWAEGVYYAQIKFNDGVSLIKMIIIR